MMSKLSKSEQDELLTLLHNEWNLYPEWTFQNLVKQFTYRAVGHTELDDEDERALLEALREGYRVI